MNCFYKWLSVLLCSGSFFVYGQPVITTYSSSNSPLPFNTVRCIAIQNQFKWFGTDNGLARFDGVNWSVYTTRRILGVYVGNELQIPTSTEINGDFGNFKDLKRDTGTATYIHKDEVVSLKYETGKASMAPINYIKFWNLKYPILNILKIKN